LMIWLREVLERGDGSGERGKGCPGKIVPSQGTFISSLLVPLPASFNTARQNIFPASSCQHGI